MLVQDFLAYRPISQGTILNFATSAGRNDRSNWNWGGKQRDKLQSLSQAETKAIARYQITSEIKDIPNFLAERCYEYLEDSVDEVIKHHFQGSPSVCLKVPGQYYGKPDEFIRRLPVCAIVNFNGEKELRIYKSLEDLANETHEPEDLVRAKYMVALMSLKQRHGQFSDKIDQATRNHIIDFAERQGLGLNQLDLNHIPELIQEWKSSPKYKMNNIDSVMITKIFATTDRNSIDIFERNKMQNEDQFVTLSYKRGEELDIPLVGEGVYVSHTAPREILGL